MVKKKISKSSKKFNISNRLSYTIIAVVALLLVGSFVYAQSYTTLGHTADQLGPGTFAAGDYIFSSGSKVGIGKSPDSRYTLDVAGNVNLGTAADELFIPGGGTLDNGLLIRSGGLQVTGGNVEVNGDIKFGTGTQPSLKHVIGSSCPSGTVEIAKKWAPETCSGIGIDGVTGQACTGCTTSSIWSNSAPSCPTYHPAENEPNKCVFNYNCVADTVSEVICIGA